MRKVLLVNPEGALGIYRKSCITAAVPKMPRITLAVLAAPLLAKGYEVQVLDLAISDNPVMDLKNKLREFFPDCVGITFTTPLLKEASTIAAMVKKYNPAILVVGGGVHCTVLPEETLQESAFDIVVIGEGDFTLCEILDRFPGYLYLKEVKGIAFKNGTDIIKTESRPLIENLDTLPFPAWRLYDLSKYRTSKITSRRNPVGGLFTGRGCVYGCTFCDKSIFGRRYRTKSEAVVLDEIEEMLKTGFKEIHIIDECLTINIKRAKKICDMIIERKLDFTWNLFSGVKVNTIDREFLEKAKRAGCYSISFGIESGTQELLDNINKNVTIEECRDAVNLAKEVGMETVAFYMIGLPGETLETMERTIKFATELDTDYAKVTITMPYPMTPLYNHLNSQGLIKSHDWLKYDYHEASYPVWEHPNLNWDVLRKYYKLFYKRYYFRPKYIFRRLKKGLLNGNAFRDAYYAYLNFIAE